MDELTKALATEDLSWQSDPLWYKDAVIYQVHIKSFFDSNGDGIGDFPGLTQKLDYIQRLGVNTIWLLPFYPSPMRDDGYDIADYRAINPVYGTRRDFRTFVREAHKRKLKVITELVINHTSDQHPWFKSARAAPPNSARRNFYVWSDDDKKFPETRIIFTDSESSNWSWDSVAKQYYWHRFFAHQPDLNHNNPRVVRAVIRVMQFWLDMGVDGLRLDAIPYLCVREGSNNENLQETHDVIKTIRAAVDERYANRMLIAEANQWPEDVNEYFAEGDECHMAYHFPLMPRMYMAIALEDRHPIVEIMEQTPDIPDSCQWAIFLRNHDELTLEMVTDRERDYMYSTYASDPRMRINVGIRRRLAPLMDNDRARIELMNSLLFSMPGSPTVYYGDELGMGDNIFLGDRNSVRTPMQWSPDRNGGFSRADPQSLFLPPIMDPVYGYEAVNVEAQMRASSSLLNWTCRILAIRRAYKAFGRGSLEILRPGNRKILAYVRRYESEILLCVANLMHSPQAVELDLSQYKGLVPIELVGRSAFPPIGELPYLLTLAGYGFYWFELTSDTEAPSWHEQWLVNEPPPWLVLFDSVASFMRDDVDRQRSPATRLRRQFETQVVPSYLAQQRWYAYKGQSIQSVGLTHRYLWRTGRGEWLLAMITAKFDNDAQQEYFLPMAVEWGPERVGPAAAGAIARVRQHSATGLLYDAFSDPSFCRDLINQMQLGVSVDFGGSRIDFYSTETLLDLTEGLDEAHVARPATEGSNTAFLFGRHLFLKAYRNLREGVHPEWEMGRFLTEASPCAVTVPTAGAVEHVAADGTRTTLALLQAAVPNQGDAWTYTMSYLMRNMDTAQTLWEVDPVVDEHMDYLIQIRTLARCTADLHKALAIPTGDPCFDPEPFDDVRLRAWGDTIQREVGRTIELLRAHRTRSGRLDSDISASDAQLHKLEGALNERIETLVALGATTQATRVHGDYHLGQVLINDDKFIIVDFEGEPGRAFDERRNKTTVLKDVAGMLRSFDYARNVAEKRLLDEGVAERAEIDAMLDYWQTETRTAFFDAYRDAMQTCPSYPSDPGEAERLTELGVLEKLLYELRYEVENRPAWLRVPWRDLNSRFTDTGQYP